jgi:DNA gyrase subunit A
VVLQTETALTTQELLTITRDGKAYTLTVNDIPATQRQGRGCRWRICCQGRCPPMPMVIATQMLLTKMLSQDYDSGHPPGQNQAVALSGVSPT